MKAQEFYKQYFGEDLPTKKFLIEPEDLIIAMTEYAHECLLTFYINDEIQNAINFLYENPDQDKYINSNIEHFMNGDEPDDNSMQLYSEWQEYLYKVFGWLKELINYDNSTNKRT